MPTLPANERSEIDEAETQAFRQRVGCASRVAKSKRLISAFEAAFAAGLSGKARATDSLYEDVVSGLAT